MFRRLFLLALGILLVTSMAFAGTDNRTIIDAVTLKAAPTSATSVSVYMQENKKAAFFVAYDETETSGTAVASVTSEVSYDNTNWLATNLYDNAGATTAQTSETITTDGWYYFWLTPDLLTPYARVKVTCTGCNASDTVVTSVYEVVNK
jgi:hypothetical protein